MSKLKNNPIDSKCLNKTFEKQECTNLDEKYEQLLACGINPEFASQLKCMFSEIKANTNEIIENKGAMIAANDKIYDQTASSRSTQTNLAMLQLST